MKQYLKRADDFLAQALGLAVTFLLAAAAGLGAYQVLMRFVLLQPSTWSEALTRTLLIWMVYLGAALALRTGMLVAFDVVRVVAGDKLRKVLYFAGLFFSFLFFLVVAWFGFHITDRVRFQNLAGLEMSIAWAYAALPVGAAISAITALIMIGQLLLGAPEQEQPSRPVD